MTKEKKKKEKKNWLTKPCPSVQPLKIQSIKMNQNSCFDSCPK